MHEKFRKESNDGVVSGKGWKTQGRKITKYTLLSLPPHPLFYANPNSGPCISLSSPPTFWSNEAIVERWTDRAFQLVAFMRLVILSKVSLPPQSHSVQFENLQFPASAARVHTERERSDAVISAYLHESLACTMRLHSFHPRNGELERTKFVESLITLKEGGNCCCERRDRRLFPSKIPNDRCFWGMKTSVTTILEIWR